MLALRTRHLLSRQRDGLQQLPGRCSMARHTASELAAGSTAALQLIFCPADCTNNERWYRRWQQCVSQRPGRVAALSGRECNACHRFGSDATYTSRFAGQYQAQSGQSKCNLCPQGVTPVPVQNNLGSAGQTCFSACRNVRETSIACHTHDSIRRAHNPC